MQGRIYSRFRFALLALVATGAAFSALPSGAAGQTTAVQAAGPSHAAGPIVVADARVSIDQAVKMAEQKYKARVVRAESQDEGGKKVYVLRMLNEAGHVWTVKVDAATGTMI
ncbi:MAG TPA: PepSY domain-containing protein [Steroidobacteraceae bacterium]|jgi:uncharacterized membrane protein YkoI